MQVFLSAKPGYLKVESIKAIRNISGMGLKEAKDFIEASENKEMALNVYPDKAQWLQDLRHAGVNVREDKTIVASLTALLHHAIDSRHFDVAEDLLHIVRKYTD